MNLQKIFDQLNITQANPAISIFVPTHRTFPDNQQDAIALKNALKELETRLSENYDKREAEALLHQIEQKLADHNHNYNLDTLAIFASAEDTQILNFPFQVKPRVIIDQHFATRDILRELNNAVHYYLVIVSRDQGRLLEVFNDQLVREFHQDDELQGLNFPIENTHLYTTSSNDRSNATKEENYIKEFLNRVDKSVQEVYKQNSLPIFVVGDERTVSFYQQVSDNPTAIAATVTNSTNLEAEARLLIDEAQDKVDSYRTTLQQASQAEISQAKSQNLLIEDLSSIYRAAKEGRIDQIFIRKGYVQPATVDAETLNVELNLDTTNTDDIVDDILSIVLQHGGKAHFLDAKFLDDNANLLAKARY
ncbi:hypothetical protein [Acinetobacter sp. NIPH 2699]|uniref:AOC03_06830 family ribosome hibernation factor n=1 Tax=Acinetobacter sp. NIPH 2699 TaxID=2923433 RepID=UPI001F4A8F61|nr:hypothetical protein [Acinetobacter sp. NIPH 2699]MCH7336830.1 hypothetical protein [Acinetobacter sp. NIPH 2699]